VSRGSESLIFCARESGLAHDRFVGGREKMRKRIRLSYPHTKPGADEKFYRVERLDLVDFEPGQFLDRETVRALCERTDLKIIITLPEPARRRAPAAYPRSVRDFRG
jgi:hypothetical protein